MKLTARSSALIITMIIVTLSFVSCAPTKIVELVSTPQPTSTITTTPIVTPTPKPTFTPIPTDSPVPVISADEAVIINQQIQDFLQNKGMYSQEDIQSYLYSEGHANEDFFYKLGIVYEAERNYYQIQGWLFGYTMQADDLLLIVGFDSKNNDRFVTALKIPLFHKCIDKKGAVLLTYQNTWRNPSYFHSGENVYDYEDIVSHLTLNQPFLFNFITLPLPSDEEAKEQGGEHYIELYHEENDNRQYVYNLVSQLEQNNQTVHVPANAKNFPISMTDEVSDLVGLDRLMIPTLDVLVCIDG